MLDLRLIRDQPDETARALARRGGRHSLEEVLEADAERRRHVKEAEELKAERNRASDAIGQAKRRGEDPRRRWPACARSATASRRSTSR